MAKQKEAQIWTIRNDAGQFLGTYRAIDGASAIRRMTSELAATAATFRRSQPMPKLGNLSASVES